MGIRIFLVSLLISSSAFAYDEQGLMNNLAPSMVGTPNEVTATPQVAQSPAEATPIPSGPIVSAKSATPKKKSTKAAVPSAMAASLSRSAQGQAGMASPSAAVSLSNVAEVQGDNYVITGRAENLLGKASSSSSGSVGQSDLSERALLRPAEVLEAVPGLLITQHSGDGKANQYFSRGFNLDHGTDFAFSFEGVPINEPSNAHGQGYSDLNFMIPELVKSVDYAKGPFNVEVGDFATAGSANFVYPDHLRTDIVSITAGEFGYERALGASQMDLLGGNLIYALEIDAYDGPWDVPEQFKKYNGLLRYTAGPSDNRLEVSYSAYEASWYATNQMPQDAIQAGLLDPYGNLSPTDGGDRDRDFLWVHYELKGMDTDFTALAYTGMSHLQLWNNFTFYLPYGTSGPLFDEGFEQPQFSNPDATNGEQFLEQDDRFREGGTLKYKFEEDPGKIKTVTEIGADYRNDNIFLGLYNTDQRITYETDSFNHVVETSAAPYISNTTEWTSWLKTILGFRQDFFFIDVNNETPQFQDGVDLVNATGPSGPNGILAPLSGFDEGAGPGTDTNYQYNMPEPKAALIVRPADGPVELYFNFGQGFHSNDVRELSPGTNPLAQATSEEAGFRFAEGDTFETTFSAWREDLSSELTFDGDTAASITNAASTRQGLEWSNTFRAKPFYMDLDAALSQARFLTEDYLDDPNHPGVFVPEAVEQVGTLTVGMDKVDGWSLDARVRYFGSRALTADDAIRSDPTTLVSFQLIRDLGSGQTLSFDLFNLLNQNYYDVSYYYPYALQGGAAHESVMAHDTEPRTIRVSWADHF